MGDADPEARFVARRRPEGFGEFLDRLPVAPHALHRKHLAVLEREDRLDVQELTGPAGCAPDPAAAREELERVQSEDQPRFALEARHEVVDLTVRRPMGRKSVAGAG